MGRDLCTRKIGTSRKYVLGIVVDEDGPQGKAGKSEVENTQMVDGRCK